ncbi:MotE family protein [Brevundimonas balnearis]|uniref:MotE family protein n=1 Tax=Brevundimonas balnearis TaxID=1572858 RepID=A0ABV6R6A9_9CAUL
MKQPRLLPLIAVAIGGVVAVRAIGAAPGFLEGAQAWAEELPAAVAGEGAGASPAAATPAAVCALTPEQLAEQAGISPAELRIIQSLSARREQLDAREADFATMLPLMTAAEQKLDAQVQALNAVKAEVQALLGQVDEREQAEIDRLVQVYSAMRPREAARVMATLDDEVRLPVAAAMRPRSLAAVMAQMEPAAARELTEKLARRFEAQQLAARAAAAANAPAADPPAANAQATPVAANVPAADAAASPPAAQPARQPAANRTPARQPARPPARRPAPRPAAQPPAQAAAEPAGPRPYQAGAETPAQPAAATPQAPRQSVE